MLFLYSQRHFVVVPELIVIRKRTQSFLQYAKSMKALLVTILFVGISTVPLQAGWLTYRSTNDFSGVEITDCSTSAFGKLTIPDSVNGKPVTGIRGWAFYFCTNLTEVNIPDSVTTIGPGAFSYCTSLVNVNIPSEVTVISNSTFSDCLSLESILIPSHITSIEAYAFQGCTNLEEVNIPAGVTNVGKFAFQGCSSLTSIYVESDNSHFSSNDGVLFNKPATDLIQYPMGLIGPYTLPESVINIIDGAFDQCSRITSVTLPSGIENIGHGAF